jgi:ubiquinone/menaquinone biosynthesis C-methylase UbiE
LQADAQMLPFLSKSFDLAALITKLEFLLDPLQALAEALRVARHWIFLGILNDLEEKMKKEVKERIGSGEITQTGCHF